MYVFYIYIYIFIKSIVPLAPNKVNGGQIISYNLYF